MTNTHSKNLCEVFRRIFSTFVRLLLLGYAVLAVFAFLEIQVLLRNSKNGESIQLLNGTIFVPLVLCFPENLEISEINLFDLSSTTMEDYQDLECRHLDYIIGTCASSLLFAAFSSVVFVFCDALAQVSCCSFGMAVSSGKALYLSFILAQAGLSTGALAEQNIFWVAHFKDLMRDLDEEVKVNSYVNSFILIGSSVSAFVLSFVVLVESIFYHCFCYNSKQNRSEKSVLVDYGSDSSPEKESEEAQIEEMSHSGEHDSGSGSTVTEASSELPSWITV